MNAWHGGRNRGLLLRSLHGAAFGLWLLCLILTSEIDIRSKHDWWSRKDTAASVH